MRSEALMWQDAWNKWHGYLLLDVKVHREHILNAYRRYFGNPPLWMERRMFFLPQYVTRRQLFDAIAAHEGYFDVDESEGIGDFMREKHLVRLATEGKHPARRQAQMELKRIGYVMRKEEPPITDAGIKFHKPYEVEAPEPVHPGELRLKIDRLNGEEIL